MDRVDGRDDGGGGRDDGRRRYFPTYFPSIHFLFLSSLGFSSSFFLFFEFHKNLHEIRIWMSFWFFEESINKCGM